jgi:hypothetical protein
MKLRRIENQTPEQMQAHYDRISENAERYRAPATEELVRRHPAKFDETDMLFAATLYLTSDAKDPIAVTASCVVTLVTFLRELNSVVQ